MILPSTKPCIGKNVLLKMIIIMVFQSLKLNKLSTKNVSHVIERSYIVVCREKCDKNFKTDWQQVKLDK